MGVVCHLWFPYGGGGVCLLIALWEGSPHVNRQTPVKTLPSRNFVCMWQPDDRFPIIKFAHLIKNKYYPQQVSSSSNSNKSSMWLPHTQLTFRDPHRTINGENMRNFGNFLQGEVFMVFIEMSQHEQVAQIPIVQWQVQILKEFFAADFFTS